MPRFLSEVRPNETPIFDAAGFERHPALGALVGETIATWSHIENGLAACVAMMSGGINDAEMESFIKEWSPKKRLKTVKRIAGSKLKGKVKDAFHQTLKVIMRYSKKRHAFAHGVWGSVEGLDALLLVEPKHLMRHWGKAADWLHDFEENGPSVGVFGPLDNRHIEVWTDEDLKAEVAHMNTAYELYFDGLRILVAKDPFDSSNVRQQHVMKVLRSRPAVTGRHPPP